MVEVSWDAGAGLLNQHETSLHCDTFIHLSRARFPEETVRVSVAVVMLMNVGKAQVFQIFIGRQTSTLRGAERYRCAGGGLIEPIVAADIFARIR